MEEQIKLRNCPFCGGLPVFETKNIVLRYYPRQELDHYQVKCTICFTKTKLTRHKQAIIDLWNGLPNKIIELKGEVKQK